MLSRLGALAALLLILGQPVAALAGGWGAGTPDHGGAPGIEQVQSPPQAPDTDIPARHDAGQPPALAPLAFPPIPMREPPVGPACLQAEFPMDESLTPIVHRGVLDLDEIYPSLAGPLLSSGPDTPPPASGDWIVDGRGNNVNNTTIVLNGNLNVTAGDLTLDNVTLIMNCTSDGQYGINVSSGGNLNVTNTDITAYDGSFHYRFFVYGKMEMDNCNVDEIWGDINQWREGGGLALFANGTRIRSSTISSCEEMGVQVHGCSEPQIIDTTISGNGHTGILALDKAKPKIFETDATSNSNNGMSAMDSSSPLLINCSFLQNNGSGIVVANISVPELTNCTFMGNRLDGIASMNDSRPKFINCTSLNNTGSGMDVSESARPEITNCTFIDNLLSGISIFQTSAPTIMDCNTSNNSRHGIQVADSARPTFTNCTSTGNFYSGIAMADYSIVILTDCSICDNSASGIQVMDSAQPMFSNCTSSGNKVYGMIGYDTSNLSITNCIMKNNSGHGIWVTDSARLMIIGSTLKSNSLCGISIDETSIPSLTDCSIINNSASGIQVIDSAAPIITNCTIKGNSYGGITSFASSAPFIMNCSIAENLAHGLQVSNTARPTIKKTTSAGNELCGIAIFDNSTPSLQDCSATNNSGYGMQIGDSSNPTITNCTSTANEYGIVFFRLSIGIVTDCVFTGNKKVGVAIGDQSNPTLTRCTSSENMMTGLTVTGGSFPSMDGLYLYRNGGQNVWISSTVPVALTNSTVAGGSVMDLQLSNNSRLTLLNTTHSQGITITGTAQLKVQWYASFTLLDRANRMVPGAIVDGTGRNGSLLAPITSDINGMIKDLVVTEFIQNSPEMSPESTYFSPYAFHLNIGGETNTTENTTISSSISSKFYFDFTPRIALLSDLIVKEDLPYPLNLTPYLSDQDNPLDFIGLTADRDYITVDNASHTLTIFCPEPVGIDTITITASDGLKSGNQTLSVTVTPVNDPPRCVAPITDQSVSEDQTLELNLTDHFWDEESGTSLRFTCNKENITIDNAKKKAVWMPGEGNSSLIGVVFTASDGFLTCDSNPFDITYIPVNDPPVYLGGLKDNDVLEHTNWTINLDDFFADEEDQAGLRFESSNDDVRINRLTRQAVWSPVGNSSHTIEVYFTARDADNSSMTAESGIIRLTYVLVDDPPRCTGKIPGARLKIGEEWNITLEEYFTDEDSPVLRFFVNNPALHIIELSKAKHCAIWKPKGTDTNLTNVNITAYDGTTRTSSAFFNLTFDAPVEVMGPSPIIKMIQSIPLYIYVLLPVGIIAGVAAFYAYRKVKYGKYTVEQVFLINKDGRLLAHKSRKELPGGGEDIISGMLTALQGFIKEFLRDEKQGELEEMKYGDLKIVIERGKRVYLAVFLSGYVTDELKSEMKDIIQKVDTEMGAVLDSWDGTVKALDGLKAHLGELIKEEAPEKVKK